MFLFSAHAKRQKLKIKNFKHTHIAAPQPLFSEAATTDLAMTAWLDSHEDEHDDNDHDNDHDDDDHAIDGPPYALSLSFDFVASSIVVRFIFGYLIAMIVVVVVVGVLQYDSWHIFLIFFIVCICLSGV
jgi:hypothetical protein